MKMLVIDCLTGGKGSRKFSRDFIGAGPRYIAGFVQKITNNNIETQIIRGEDFIRIKKPPKDRLLAISAMSMDIVLVNKVFSHWKKSFTDLNSTLSLLGGPISSTKSISRKVDVDLIFSGQSELFLFEIFHTQLKFIKDGISGHLNKKWKKKLSNNLNFLFQKNKNLYKNWDKKKKYIKKINQIFKNSSGYPEKICFYKNYKFARVYVELLRGCSNFRRIDYILENGHSCRNSRCNICRSKPFRTQKQCPEHIPPGCGFCSTIALFGSPKSRKVNHIISEIKKLIQIGVKRIVLGGSDFLDFHRDTKNHNLISPTLPKPNSKKIDELIENLLEIKEIKEKRVQIFIENVKPSLCTERVLNSISKIPNSIFSIGCETGSERFSNHLGRPNGPEETYNSIKKSINLGIRVHVYFIHSLPGDNKTYAKNTLSFIKRLSKLDLDKFTLYKFRLLDNSPFSQIKKLYFNHSNEYQKIIRKIKKFCKSYNYQQKMKMKGKEFKIYISELNKNYPKDAIGWILKGGPKVNLKNGKKYLGEYVNVKITKVLSDKLVMAKKID